MYMKIVLSQSYKPKRKLTLTLLQTLRMKGDRPIAEVGKKGSEISQRRGVAPLDEN